MRRISNLFFALAVTLAMAFGAAWQMEAAEPGTVYIVMGSDTAVWNAPGGIAVQNYRNHFDPALFTSPETNAFHSIDPAFRAQFVDSFGQPLKMSWWLLVGSVYGESDNVDVPVPNLMPLYLMQKYHGETLRQLGDEVTLHYHTFLWSDYNADGVFYWNEAQTFHECRGDWDQALAQSLIEEEVFPVSFRSGWHYMDNEWQQYLNELLPYNMDNDSPNRKGWSAIEPEFNVLDWSQASLEFVPFRPAATNYQVAGDGPGWNVRSVKFVNVTQTLIDHTFDEAAKGVDQVASLWGHLAEPDFVPQIARVHSLIQTAADAHPGIRFRYCTAVEGMQRWRGMTNQAAPTLTITQEIAGDALTLKIISSEALFQPQPFVASKDIFQHYAIEQCTPIGSNAWSVAVAVPRSELAKIGIAATDLSGNLTTKLLRFVPEDLYLDNLDPQFHASEGAWTNSPVAAWGTNSVVAPVRAGQVASASWMVPVSESGVYNILVQFPKVEKLSTNVQFTLRAGEQGLFTNDLAGGFSADKWIYLGTAALDAAQSNVLEMTVRGAGAAEEFAAADVVRVTPLPVQLPGAITGVTIDAGDTTANVLWSSLDPSGDFIKYGSDKTLGRFSATNNAPVRKHVVTLSGLTPGKDYIAQINSAGVPLKAVWESSFKTSTNTPVLRINFIAENGATTFYWNGAGTILERADELGGQTVWTALGDAVSPFRIAGEARGFFRLRR